MARAKDKFDASGGWGTFEVTIPRNRATFNSLFLWLFERFPNLFPILRFILGFQ